MGWLQAITAFFKVVLFFVNMWKEKDQAKAKKKKEIKGEIVNALKEKDKKKRASMLNRAIDDINGMR